MEKIKVLAIAPYEGLKDLINDVAKDSNELEVHTYVSDMLDGVELAKSMQYKGYSVIISRAGTADLIRNASYLPVIDIKLSVLDMMRSIKLAQNYSGKYAVVGFQIITETTQIICELLQFEVETKTVYNISEIEEKLNELKSSGFSLIVGDVITVTYAKKLGFNTILVTTGRESVINALDEVIKLHSAFKVNNKKNLLFQEIIEGSSTSALAFDINGSIIFSSIKDDIQDYPKILEELLLHIDTVIKQGAINIIKKIGSSYINIKGDLLEDIDNKIIIFYLKNHRDYIRPYDNAVSYWNVSDFQHLSFNALNTSNDELQEVINNAKIYSKLNDPVIIYGQKGTGKDAIVHAIYQNSNLCKNPLVIIDCNYMNQKKWVSIFESDDSVFANVNITIYFKNFHLIDEDSQLLIEDYMFNTLVHRRNKIIFSCIRGFTGNFEKSSLLYFVRNTLSALPLVLPTLNDRKEDIPNLASIYISELNIKYSKQVIGLEEEATLLLREFNWVNNLDQFKRVLNEIIVLTEGSYITAKVVNQVLSNELISKLSYGDYSLNLNKTLDEISTDIIKIVLEQENQNQSNAARRLGISRSTMWRKIKD